MSIGALRVRLQFSPPLPSNRCWYEVSYADRHTLICDLAASLWHDFDLKKVAKVEQLKLEVDGFELGKSSTTKGVVREGDLIVVSCVQGDSVASPGIDVRAKRKRRVSFSSTEGSESKSKRTKTVTNGTVSGNKKVHVASEVDKIQVDTKDTVEAENDSSSESSSDETSNEESSEEESEEELEEASEESSEESSEEASEESSGESPDESSDESSKESSVVKSLEKEQKGDLSKQANLKESKVGSKENRIYPESRTPTVNGLASQKEVGRPQVSVKGSETGQVGKRISRSPAGATISDITPPLSLGKKKKRQLGELINRQRVHVRFSDADDEEEPAAEQDVVLKKNATLSQASVKVGGDHVRFGDGEDYEVTQSSEPSFYTSTTPSRVIYTQVYLKDDQKYKGKKRRNRQRYSLEGQTTDGEDANGSAPSTSVSASAVEKAPKKDYTAMPALVGHPVRGQTIAYKILEMSDTYCPTISDFKEGLVLSVDTRRSLVTLKLNNSFPPAAMSNEGDEEVEEGMRGKFDLPPDDWYILEGAQDQEIITLELASLVDTRIVP
ncbi:hypothetical protein SpCBS45565_g01781 [Spizellomyces sp. 'palustris']|nr:hypothetical protein SpCBS45565_g01781 [Spizellomyces sp. 'palustris']